MEPPINVRRRGQVNSDEDKCLLDRSFRQEYHNTQHTLVKKTKENQQKERNQQCGWVLFFLALQTSQLKSGSRENNHRNQYDSSSGLYFTVTSAIAYRVVAAGPICLSWQSGQINPALDVKAVNRGQ